ncbi:Ig-like domain-containing protein [Mycobacterium adipatum]|uniref:Ig-like domain-containing protein n=1 Tax=Mycobacterium adipatum TaxID=1682113 RepID=UPI0034E08922
MQVRYASHIGRVGALAVALGIGAAVGTPATAWAAPEDPTTTSSSAAETEPGTGTDRPASTPGPDASTVGPRTPTSAPRSVAAPAGDEVATPQKKKRTAATRVRTVDTTMTVRRTAERPRPEPTAELTAPDGGAAVDTPAAVTATPPSVTTVPATLAARPVVANPVQAVGDLIGRVVRPVLSTVLGVLPGGSTDSPLAWVLLGAARRQVGQPEQDVAGISAARTVAAAVPNAPPTATVIWGRPDATTGTVIGRLVAADPEGKKVAVAVVPPPVPVQGTMAYNAKTATITYTPTTAQRFAASTSPGDDSVAITLRVTDAVNTVEVPISIPVSPSPFYQSTAYPGGGGPSAVAATNTRAYITDRDTGTVTVYDTIKNTLVGTYQVGGAPDGIAVKRDGTRIYVASSTGNTVTVIDTATGAKKATITVANPTAISINPAGSVVYVANGTGATVTKISTATNRAAGTVKLAPGLTPTELAVSADGKRIFVAGAKAAGGGQISWFSSTASTATLLADTAVAPTGLAYNSASQNVYAVDAGGGLTVYSMLTKTVATLNVGHPLSGIALTNDGSAAMVTTSTGMVAALSTRDSSVLGVTTIGVVSAQPVLTISPDGTQMFVTDLDNGSVHALSLVPSNVAPFSSDPNYTVTNPATGAMTGKVGVVDFDGDPLTYQVTVKPGKGKLVLNADGTYTYTPTAAARHAASVPAAPDTVTTDSFTVVVSDGRHGTVTQTITIAIDPANKVPTVTTSIGSPSASTGAVKVTIKTADGDNDKRTFTATQPAKGAVQMTGSGVFTYTPSVAALAAARAPGAAYEDRRDTFTVTVDDGHGGVVPVTVNVKIGAPNVKPTAVTASVTATQPRSGVITGTVGAVDADGDVLSYSAGKTNKGTVTLNADGSFTYTPTAAARLAASKPRAGSATKSETITFTVSDGFGGVVTKTLKVTIVANPADNAAPTNGAGTVSDTSTAIGSVTGVVTATDLDGDALTFRLASGPAFGVATVSAAGGFVYTPDVDARYRALVTAGEDTDSFVVDITDSFGGISTATVHVTIAPPSTTAIDQRATTVAVNTQQMYFYSQTDTDMALGLLKAAGVETIRILLPWAGAEPVDDTFDWAAVDRMVNSAKAQGIKVLATLNTTPDWAAVPGQQIYTAAPADIEAFGDFVSAVATRYQGKIADYEIWNEPNYDGFWEPGPDAAAYTALLKVAYTAIKAADPDATVIGGSVAAVAEVPGGPAINPVTYLSQMYAAGAAGYFDALAFHPYLYSMPFSAQQGHAGVPFAQAQQLYEVMVAHGDGHKKIWATEYGQPASEGGEAVQAAYVGDFLRAWRSLEFAGPAFIHTIADYGHDFPDQATMGLFREDWTPKPVVAVITQVIAENQAINAVGGDSV